jgi:site-specific DNA-methyltransferase (cytosine-N4-specific)
MELNKVYNEPCLETLKRMPDGFLDCVITSPPYWQLRDYGYKGQWGMEPTYQEYLEHLWQMMDEIYRVLKPEGTVWINLGDTYSSNRWSNTKSTTGKSGNYADILTTKNISEPNKCLLLIPHRFAIGCIDRGWIMRNDCIWAKRNAMPESITDRFSKKHEYFFFMVKSEKYFFDLDSIRDKQKSGSSENNHKLEDFANIDASITAANTDKERPQYSILDKEFRNPIVEVRDLPNHDVMRVYLKEARVKSGLTIERIEELFGTQAPHHWFEKNGSYPAKEDWAKLKEILGLDDQYDHQMTNVEYKSGLKENNIKGKNPGDVADFWDIPTKPSTSKHYASYSDALLVKPILAGCPEGGIVYDPFGGTGSTAEVSIRAKRNFIASEMSEEYCVIHEKRLYPFLTQPGLF